MAWGIAIFLVINLVLIYITNVPTHLTESDEIVFRTVLNLKVPNGSRSFDEEIEIIRAVQYMVLLKAPVGAPIPEQSEREPEDLFKQQSGLCYDRSRTYDKVFSWLGFESRHVYILYPEHPSSGARLSLWQAFFTRGTNSHAVTEVKTSRGWVLVDSNSAWISVARDGSPVGVDRLHEQAARLPGIPAYFDRPYWAVRGLYSRRGQFYRPYVPYPQLNWTDFMAWLVE